MIYPKDFEQKIGFSSLRSLLKSMCETPMGARLVEEMEFKSKIDIIKRELGCVAEMKKLIDGNNELPPFIFSDVALWIKHANTPGSYLTSQQMMEVSLTFQTMSILYGFFHREGDGSVRLQYLRKEFENIPVFETLEKEISRCIDKEGNVKDNATEKLSEIRAGITSLSRSMHKIIQRVLSASISKGVVERDTTPAIREGRMVIPVEASKKRTINGIVHDISASGKTVYIEPSEVVEAGNHLRELQKEEEQEIIAILVYLTDLLRQEKESIIQGCNLLAQYDFIKAKANFAICTGGEMPVIESSPEIDWYHAVHPGLLITLRKQGREAVAMNLKLDKNNRMLLISGPNAGGKSVTLKTVGTIQYMLQCGLLPTMYSNSHAGVFSSIFIDIGDEQSIENDLSTYSSHLVNMKYFLQHANKQTLILADEMGSGTEPQIGAALAQSILEKLGKTGCFGIITTHYQNLKIFADKTEGFVNGAMLYDRQHLRPTFQLSIGEPGSSFALEIARNIGLSSEVIEEAKNLVGTDYVNSEKFLLEIQRDKRYWKNKRLEIKEKESKLNRLLEEYESKADELKNERSTILREAKKEAKEILQGANSQIERSIHEIRKSQAEKEKAKKVRKELEEYKKSLDNPTDETIPETLKPLRHKSKRKLQEEKKLHAEPNKNIAYNPGDYVKLESGGVVGTVISIDNKKATVAFGNLRTTVNISQLQPAKKPQTPRQAEMVVFVQDTEADSRQRRLNFKNEIDVRGFRADEAIQAITYFLDDALQFNIGRVRILHGTGYGILRNLIRQQLESNPNVKSYRDEDVRFGGAGITVVEL